MADAILAIGGLLAVFLAILAIAAFVWLLIQAFSRIGESNDEE